MAHQWLILPEAVSLHPYAGPKVLCGYPDCPGAADLRVGFPFQEPVLYCTEHAATSITRATVSPPTWRPCLRPPGSERSRF